MSTYQKEELILLVKAVCAAILATLVHVFTVNVLNTHPWIVLVLIGLALAVITAFGARKYVAFGLTYFVTSIVWTVVFF
ncbi:MAG: hypothetical protein GX072_13165 [Lysinibacillus sp.]|nr:hypothetical protein [Lysinibacillus sp.]